MKTYKEVFDKLKQNKQGALVAFIVAGDPDYKASIGIAKTIVDAGADILEIGIPFSDPIADGPTIQEADIRALKNGMNTDKFFEFISELREYTDVPIGILCYYNLVYQRNSFYSDAKKCGVNSVLIADLPIEEYKDALKQCRKNNLDTVLMISPLTSNERIKRISSNITGFIYAVSRLGVTGAKSDLQESTLKLVQRIKKYSGKPLCVGFGISKPEHVKSVIKSGADGAIVGSAIVEIVGKTICNKPKILKEISAFVKELKQATKQ